MVLDTGKFVESVMRERPPGHSVGVWASMRCV
jgi:hypothetical protein